MKKWKKTARNEIIKKWAKRAKRLEKTEIITSQLKALDEAFLKQTQAAELQKPKKIAEPKKKTYSVPEVDHSDNKHKKHNYSQEMKFAIIFKRRQDPEKSNKKIAKEIAEEYDRPSITHKEVKRIIEKDEKTGDVQNSWAKIGRRRTITDEEVKDMVNFVKKNRTTPVQEVINQLGINAGRTTATRYLLKEGLRAYRAPKKFVLSQINIKKRNEFANTFKN